ncbi:MAG: addiction module protein [Myxococcales bacterium]|nr:addiction module protein [Myxococcales bacterium]
MSSTAKKILHEALALPEEDRVRLAEHLLDSVPRETAEMLERAWNEEALRRAEALADGETTAIDGEVALTRLENKLRALHRR